MNITVLYFLLLCIFHKNNAHNVVQKDKLKLNEISMAKKWHLYLKQFLAKRAQHITNIFSDLIPSLLLLAKCKLFARMNTQLEYKRKNITGVIGFIDVFVAFVKRNKDIVNNHDQFQVLGFSLDKALRVNLTFGFTQFSSSRNKICAFQNLTVASHTTQVVDVFTSCEKLSQFHVFPKFPQVEIVMNTAKHKWDYHYFRYQFTLLFSVMDQQVLESIQPLNRISHLEWLLKTTQAHILGLKIQVKKFQSIEIRAGNRTTSSCLALYDGPGVDSQAVNVNFKSFFTTLSFQCVIQQRISTNCTQDEISYRQINLSVSLVLNSQQTEYSYSSSNNKAPVLVNIPKYGQTNLNITFPKFLINGRFPHLCDFGGISAFHIFSLSIRRLEEAGTFCKTHTKVYKTKPLYSTQSLLLVIYNYPEYRNMSFHVVVSRTACAIATVEPCKLEETLIRTKYMEIVVTKEYLKHMHFNRSWVFRLVDSECAVFEFVYKQMDKRQKCTLAFHHSQMRQTQLS